jgi:hypothetical protein
MVGLSSVPIEAAGLLITDWCPARCRHCYVSAGPDRGAWMTLAAAEGHLAALARLRVPAEGIHIGGGEPFGNFDLLLAIVRAARKVGLPGIGYVETNGFWAESEDVIRKHLTALSEAGMLKLSISADPYHQEFVPPDRVRLLHAVAIDVLGLRGVRARRWRWLQAPHDVAAMPESERVEFFRGFLRQYPERLNGRAAECLAPLADRRPPEDLPAEDCRAALLESKHLHVDPDGWVVPGTCAGISTFRATPQRPLDKGLLAWQWQKSHLVAWLVEKGPRGLLKVAEARGYRRDPAGYAGKCHLCWSIRKYLVGIGASEKELQPRGVYALPA